jgi:SPP1 family predicted phage head-tail adaptor
MRTQTVGLYRQRVNLQDLTETLDSYGQPEQAWNTIATFWAEVRELRGSELLNVKQNWATATHYVSCRWQGASLTVATRMRFQIQKDGRVLNIVDWNNVEERNRQFRFICEEYKPGS